MNWLNSIRLAVLDGIFLKIYREKKEAEWIFMCTIEFEKMYADFGFYGSFNIFYSLVSMFFVMGPKRAAKLLQFTVRLLLANCQK